ncbi:type II toxin-antitoxin system RelE/ParE family toxin [Burkholderia pyrrocinia]|uniref:type II toxin-antitoxin system RelE/ParE family toxin n=1 Tax=Burkholderia pyrrocinia TaxID=60550 RepID=UPI001FC7D629|nr:type II toxin-antitoxin system RelE/ParE family toxin [Burkholderia pyrrocinia]
MGRFSRNSPLEIDRHDAAHTPDLTLALNLSAMRFAKQGQGHIRPGLRITNYKGSAIIAFAVIGEVVYVIGVFYGGQDYEAVLSVTAGY